MFHTIAIVPSLRYSHYLCFSAWEIKTRLGVRQIGRGYCISNRDLDMTGGCARCASVFHRDSLRLIVNALHLTIIIKHVSNSNS